MHANEQLITTFYTSFQQLDPDGMAACYHPEVVFSDPVFQTLQGAQAVAMWHMLAGRSKELVISFSDVQADEQKGIAHWEAHYIYSATNRKVHNVVQARFNFQEGRIVLHQDEFDLWKWASQALGTSGKLLGWTPFMQHTIHQKAAQTLEDYMNKQPVEK